MKLQFDDKMFSDLMKVCKKDGVAVGTLITNVVREYVNIKLNDEECKDGRNQPSTSQPIE
jgi:hypothetical protein